MKHICYEAASLMTKENEMQASEDKNFAKIPVQERGKIRFNTILASAEILLLELDIEEISFHKIAKHAGISATSVYQYFPTMGTLFSTIAEAHFVKTFDIVNEKIDNACIRKWQDLANIFVDSAYEFYCTDQISVILSLGMNSAPGVKELTAERITRFAAWYTDKFSLLYKKKDLEILIEKIAICVEIMRGIYIRNISTHGKLTEFYREESRVIILSYLAIFFESLE